VSAGLLIRALSTVQRIDPGFSREGVLTVRADLPMPAYRLVATREALYARVLQQIRAMPGVSAAGMVSFLPMSSFRGGIQTVSVKGDADAGSDTRSANNTASLRYATPGYFAAMGTRLRRGRDIAETDGQDRQFVAVVSESFVRRYWPGQDPLGQHFTFAAAEREVVGVVADVRFRGLERESEPQVYLPSAQVADGGYTFYAPRSLAVRASGDPTRLARDVRDVIRRADPRTPIVEVRTLGELMERETASRSVQVRVLAVFAAVAFVLAAVGIHGLLAFTVSQRTQEIGVRMALGASAGDIVTLIARRMLLLATMGVIPGVLLAYMAGRSMQALLAGVPPADLTALASAVAFSMLMTILGSLLPTLRALRVEPSTALRAE
jgi:predicted permease